MSTRFTKDEEYTPKNVAIPYIEYTILDNNVVAINSKRTINMKTDNNADQIIHSTAVVMNSVLHDFVVFMFGTEDPVGLFGLSKRFVEDVIEYERSKQNGQEQNRTDTSEAGTLLES